MGTDKVASFYEDRVKREVDAGSLLDAYWLRSISIDTGATWRARRLVRFLVSVGRNALRRRHIQPSSQVPYKAAADSAHDG
jgi:hypothetical protein